MSPWLQFGETPTFTPQMWLPENHNFWRFLHFPESVAGFGAWHEFILQMRAHELDTLKKESLPPKIHETILAVKKLYGYRWYMVDGVPAVFDGLEVAWDKDTFEISKITMHLKKGDEKISVNIVQSNGKFELSTEKREDGALIVPTMSIPQLSKKKIRIKSSKVWVKPKGEVVDWMKDQDPTISAQVPAVTLALPESSLPSENKKILEEAKTKWIVLTPNEWGAQDYPFSWEGKSISLKQARVLVEYQEKIVQIWWKEVKFHIFHDAGGLIVIQRVGSTEKDFFTISVDNTGRCIVSMQRGNSWWIRMSLNQEERTIFQNIQTLANQ